jgi:hypothetical protein
MVTCPSRIFFELRCTPSGTLHSCARLSSSSTYTPRSKRLGIDSVQPPELDRAGLRGQLRARRLTIRCMVLGSPVLSAPARGPTHLLVCGDGLLHLRVRPVVLGRHDPHGHRGRPPRLVRVLPRHVDDRHQLRIGPDLTTRGIDETRIEARVRCQRVGSSVRVCSVGRRLRRLCQGVGLTLDDLAALDDLVVGLVVVRVQDEREAQALRGHGAVQRHHLFSSPRQQGRDKLLLGSIFRICAARFEWLSKTGSPDRVATPSRTKLPGMSYDGLDLVPDASSG